MNDAGREYIKGVRERAKGKSFNITRSMIVERLMRLARESKRFELSADEHDNVAVATLMEDEMNAEDVRRGDRKKFATHP